jgi:hypothetical protein
MGNALGIAQFGGTAPTAKPWKGLGPGVLEVLESHDGNAYRAVSTVRFEKACTSCTRSRRSLRPVLVSALRCYKLEGFSVERPNEPFDRA